MSKKRLLFLFVLFDALVGGAILLLLFTPIGHRVRVAVFGGQTVEQRIEEFGSRAQAAWLSRFADAGLQYPPRSLALVADKSQRVLHVYAGAKFVCTLPIVEMSGELGPKLAEGDRQVPEGVYEIESLNPNSAYHVSLRVNYPNDVDREAGSTGSDIMIHGKDRSIGCLAMGDPAAEQLFFLADLVGIDNIEVLLCPVDFRVAEHEATTPLERDKYDRLRIRLARLEAVP